MAEENDLIRVAERALESVRAEIYLNLKFLWLAMNRLKFVPTTEEVPGTAATDGESAYYNAKWLLKTYAADYKKINRVTVHLMLHCVFRHFCRGKKEEYPDLWDLASDMHVANILDDFRLPFLSDGKEESRKKILDEMKNRGVVMTAEGIYKDLEKSKTAGGVLPGRTPFYEDDHCFFLYDTGDAANGNSQSKEDSSEEDWEEIAGKVLADLQFFNRSAASDALSRDLKVDTRRKFSYRAFLRRMLSEREIIKENPDEFDYIFYSYGLSLYGNMPLVENLEYREQPGISDLVIVIDTSGSTYEALTDLFLRETYAVVKESGVGRFHLRILQCDDAVRADDVVDSDEDFEELMEHFSLKGGGGTDFRQAFAYIDDLMEKGELKRVKGVLYFTDGKGIYPKQMPPYDVAFVFADENYRDREVPSWAMKLVVGEEELKAL